MQASMSRWLKCSIIKADIRGQRTESKPESGSDDGRFRSENLKSLTGISLVVVKLCACDRLGPPRNGLTLKVDNLGLK